MGCVKGTPRPLVLHPVVHEEHSTSARRPVVLGRSDGTSATRSRSRHGGLLPPARRPESVARAHAHAGPASARAPRVGGTVCNPSGTVPHRLARAASSKGASCSGRATCRLGGREGVGGDRVLCATSTRWCPASSSATRARRPRPSSSSVDVDGRRATPPPLPSRRASRPPARLLLPWPTTMPCSLRRSVRGRRRYHATDVEAVRPTHRLNFHVDVYHDLRYRAHIPLAAWIALGGVFVMDGAEKM